MAFSITKSIQSYRQNYGNAWEIFWDYATDHPLRRKATNTREYATQLFCFLCCFGMARAKTNLAKQNLDDFEDFVSESRDILIDLGDYEFMRLRELDRVEFNNKIASLKENLSDYGISSTNLMVSKIVMAVTGQCPATDRFFANTHRECFGRGVSCNLFTTLMLLKGRYEDEWGAKMNRMNRSLTLTNRGKNNKIPVARLIDMAFWYRGMRLE